MVNFSVIIPTHNRNNFLSRAIKLSLSQRKMPFEILIIDDCDNFETKKILNTLQDWVEVERPTFNKDAVNRMKNRA